MDWETLWSTGSGWITQTGIKLVVAVLVMAVSFALINRLGKRIAEKHTSRIVGRKQDKTLARAIATAVRIGLKLLVVICLIGYLGLDTSGITAVIASLGVSVGLAVNGTLSNIAGGVLLVITRPFSDDDYIEACGYSGTVEDIKLCSTKLRTVDNKVVYLPNGKLSTSEIVNYSEKPLRRVDIVFSVSYSDDFGAARDIILSVARSCPLVVSEPEPSVCMDKQSASSIDLLSKLWCKNGDYWTVRAYMLENVKTAFDKNGITIPFNQLDVNIKGQ